MEKSSCCKTQAARMRPKQDSKDTCKDCMNSRQSYMRKCSSPMHEVLPNSASSQQRCTNSSSQCKIRRLGSQAHRFPDLHEFNARFLLSHGQAMAWTAHIKAASKLK